MTNGLAVIFCGFISHLIGRETINIPEIFSVVQGFTGRTVTHVHFHIFLRNLQVFGIMIKLGFNNNCLIFRALIIINKSADGQNFNLCKLSSSTFSCQTVNFSSGNKILLAFLSSQSKVRNAIDNVLVILSIIHLSLFTASLRRLFPRHLTILWSCYCKNKLTSVFFAPLSS